MGKLITLYNPIVPKAGSTTLAIALATSFSWWSMQKTLLVNYAVDKAMEDYLTYSVQVKYSLDFLNMFNKDLEEGWTDMLVTSVNDKLDVIGGVSVSNNKNDENFQNQFHRFLEIAKQKYKFIIIDMSNNIDCTVLDKSDILLPVVPLNQFVFKALKENSKQMGYLEKLNVTTLIINNLHSSLKEEVDGQMEKLGIDACEVIAADVNAYYQTCLAAEFYNYMTIAISKNSKSTFVDDLLNLAFEILKSCDSDLDMEPKKRPFFNFLKKKKES